MCGITGFVNKSGVAASQAVLADMVETLRHRGPDARGMFLHENVALGHARLSIIDLSQGGQPMRYDSRPYVITFNGEIYNFPQLKTQLAEAGYLFRTSCDTEVLLAAYIHWGEACLAKLNGMFSLAIWDGVQRRLLLARDRMGQKPLYYGLGHDSFVFASELKAILAHPAMKPALHREALMRYMVFEYVPAPDSIFIGIHKLPAGHYLWLHCDDLQLSAAMPYWDSGYTTTAITLAEAQEKFLHLFTRAVERHLISDVPVGVFLSGGIDSSALVALASRYTGNEPLRTFSIHFREKSFDESHYSEQVARLFHTDHHSETFTTPTLYSVLPAIANGLDEPLADPSILPTYLLARFTRNFVKVALGGDGGDELFAGYDPFLAIAPANLWYRMPGWLQRLAGHAASWLPVSSRNVSLDFKINRFLLGAAWPPESRLAVWMSAFSPSLLNRLFTPEFTAGLSLDESFVLAPALDQMHKLPKAEQCGLQGALRFYAKLYLCDDILAKVDRASMLNSLEVRAPFLDTELVDFVNSLPPHYKLHGFTRKYLFKKAMQKILPHRVVYRRKKGFGIPVASWLKHDLSPLVRKYLNPTTLDEQRIFRPQYVQQLVQEHTSGYANHAKPLWALLMFMQWAERWQPQV
jgi:asparagine synthase (glutamine-hydrolysing)